ncbi:hypothetical protein BO79DRAFT_214378 [Aspergillus costaricaensis CBS 115574]|uniref:Uncharacterized protein n=1 Tax=Aspergillus costaricaensis CBS 115574 TaxID=1448317 RepID=A0ACD1IPJ3_9EURO|nr:hypothetical protein BO79DRAFT_214378 [Aspergillus costaricaensis CBS 115574]RAK92184.1 hypothetical protein BO79DRAFT_214378 [Aspergillus costaricaensis CBS 115574]
MPLRLLINGCQCFLSILLTATFPSFCPSPSSFLLFFLLFLHHPHGPSPAHCNDGSTTTGSGRIMLQVLKLGNQHGPTTPPPPPPTTTMLCSLSPQTIGKPGGDAIQLTNVALSLSAILNFALMTNLPKTLTGTSW